MKKLILIYIGFFFVSGIIGYYHGQKVVTTEDYLAYAYSTNVHPELIESGTSKDEPVVELVYTFGPTSSTLYRYNVGSNKPYLAGKGLQENYFNSSPNYNSPLFSNKIVFSFLGGSTASLTLPKLMKYANQSKTREITSGLIGAISGYLVGYKIGITHIPAADSRQMKKLLSDEQIWRTFKVKAYYRIYRAIVLARIDVRQVPRADSLKEIDRERYFDVRVEAGREDLGLKQFILAFGLLKDLSSLVNKNYKDYLVQHDSQLESSLELPWWLGWPYILLVCAVGLMMLAVVLHMFKNPLKPPNFL